MTVSLRDRIKSSLGMEPVALGPLSGGCVGQVYRVCLPDNHTVIAKVDERASSQLELEGMMLRYLAEKSNLPVPALLHSSRHLLIIEFLPGSNRFSAKAQCHAAELLAALHEVNAHAFGLDQDTLIGGLRQPNPWSAGWISFFREQRLLYMGREATQTGRLPKQLLTRLERFSERLDEWLEEPERPSLIHGDAWSGNILALDDRITGFIDPAIYYAHAEIELAFTTLFGTFDNAFFDRYHELRPIRPGFLEVRRDIYNLYPLLVHVRLFGGGYIQSVEQTLGRFGY